MLQAAPVVGSLFALVLCVATSVHADEALLERLVAENTYDLKSDNETIGGSGLEFLLDATENAQFFCFAEPHNVKQVPLIFTMLFEALHETHGFRYAALETGPVILELAGGKPVRGDRGAVDRLFAKYPKSFQFFTDQELQMMADVGRLSDAKDAPLWGVDQVHGTVAVLAVLMDQAGDEAGEKIEALIEEVRDFNRKRGRSPEFLKQDNDAFDRVRTWLATPMESREEFLLDQLRISRRIYRDFVRAKEGEPTGYASNCLREDNMKSLFMHYYRKAQASGDPLPKVMFKLGHWHLMKGISPGNCYTLGTFAMDLAKSNGMSSFHVMVSVVNEGKNVSSITKYPQYEPVTRAGSVDRWTIVDLRPLRGYMHSGALTGVHADLRHWIFSYDAVLMIGGTSGGSYVTEAKRRFGLK